MKIQWLGHSAFLITAGDGMRLLTDPYTPGSYDGAVGYRPITERVAVVTVSHEHPDHSGASLLPDNPAVVTGTGDHTTSGIKITGIPSFHDPNQGRERGTNTVFNFEIDGIRFCHLGDLGESLSPEACARLGPIDVLMVPVGGFYTIDAPAARALVDLLKPRVVLPMHYKTDVLKFPIAPVDDFLEGRADVKRLDTSEVELTKSTLPKTPEVWVLHHAR